MDNSNTKELLSDLFDEFEQEKNDLKIRYDDNLNRIDIIDSTIEELKRYNDESNMFSPRNVSNDNSDRIEELNKEKADIEEENKVILNQLKYYTDKSQSISSVFANYEEDTSKNTSDADESFDVLKEGMELKNSSAVKEETDRTSADGILIKKENIKDTDIVFSRKEFDSLISRLERVIPAMESDLVKCKVELGTILYDLRHKLY